MKVLFTLPKNEEFFNQYASLVPTLRKLGYLAQVISALTEFGILYALIRASLKDLFPLAAGPAALAGAVLGVAFLEVGLRQFAPYSVRAILYKRFTGLHLVISVFVFAVTLGLLSSCGYLSFRGSFDLVEQVAPPPQLATTTQADSSAQARKGEALASWQRDSLAVVNRFTPQQEATLAKYSALKAAERQKLKGWESREREEGNRYSTQKAAIKAHLAALEAEQADELARMEQDKGKALESALEAREEALGLAVTTWQRERAEVEAGNRAATDETAGKVQKYGGGLAWFTVIALTVFVLAVSIEEIHRKGSEIEEIAQPNQYHFSESVFAEFWGMLSERWNYLARTWIRKQAAKTPPPPQPEPAPELWEVERPKMNRKKATTQGQPDEQPEEESQYFHFFERAFSANGNGHNGQAHNATVSNEAPRTIIQPFRRPQEALVPAPVITEPLVRPPGIPPKACLHCGQTYAPKVAWQRYCCEDCKTAYHAAKHGGQVFNPKKYRHNK
ncbi:MAG: hypothetical protein WA004_21405 [Saprospiraceae bacterium]